MRNNQGRADLPRALRLLVGDVITHAIRDEHAALCRGPDGCELCQGLRSIQRRRGHSMLASIRRW